MKGASQISTFWRPTALALIGSVMATGCATIESPDRQSLPGTTRANWLLQRDTSQMIWLVDGIADTDCETREIIDTEIAEKPEIPGKSPWSETWTVDRCGELILYSVNFRPTAYDGGTDFRVAQLPEDQMAERLQ